MKSYKALILLLIVLNFSLNVFAENIEDSLKFVNWHNMDPVSDDVWGISTDRAYKELLDGKESHTVVVAVIDGGVDINHEDLKDKIWVNAQEIPGNGVDDDNNGYIDDIHGWNFIGNEKGEHVKEAPLEITRIYRKLSQQLEAFENDSTLDTTRFDYDYYKKINNSYLLELTQIEQQEAFFNGLVEQYARFDSIITGVLGKDDYTKDELKKMKPIKHHVSDTAKRYMMWMMRLGIKQDEISEFSEVFGTRLKYHYNTEFDARKIVGDDVEVWDDFSYGNNDVNGPTADHGTMVAGIIGASRNNSIGIKGIAEDVEFMVLRTVPDGDEWDKDVAKSIEYAIDNGADIINMSFGKEYSPQKVFVDAVIKLADERGVLLIHAAGNDAENNDVVKNYPTKYSDENEVMLTNWICVGATAKNKKKKEFVAEFSNYGQRSVDLFAPGHHILTCAPGDEYKLNSGTSFSAPMVAGAAALIKSYYPTLSAKEIKQIILESSQTKDIKVLEPSENPKEKVYVKFSKLSQTGGLLNVYAALQLAEEISTKK